MDQRAICVPLAPAKPRDPFARLRRKQLEQVWASEINRRKIPNSTIVDIPRAETRLGKLSTYLELRVAQKMATQG